MPISPYYSCCLPNLCFFLQRVEKAINEKACNALLLKVLPKAFWSFTDLVFVTLMVALVHYWMTQCDDRLIKLDQSLKVSKLLRCPREPVGVWWLATAGLLMNLSLPEFQFYFNSDWFSIRVIWHNILNAVAKQRTLSLLIFLLVWQQYVYVHPIFPFAGIILTIFIFTFTSFVWVRAKLRLELHADRSVLQNTIRLVFKQLVSVFIEQKKNTSNVMH